MRTSKANSTPWHATYRLQLTPRFTLDRALEVLPYIKELGASVAYLSPCMTSTPGSEHGYDVADPTSLSAELGGEEAFARLAHKANELGLSLLLDIVPNHMTNHGSNRYFQDVLAHGRMSSHLEKFDLYGASKTGEPLNIGTLGKPYGQALEDGELRVIIAGDTFRVAYFEHSFPVCPDSWEFLVDAQAEGTPLAKLCQRLRDLADSPEHNLEESRLQYKSICDALYQLVSQKLKSDRTKVEREIEALNQDKNRLDQLLCKQHFRLLWWKLEGEFVNYRRFFNIGSLVGVRQEEPSVFEWSHGRVRQLIETGQIQGLRVDHPDGLHHPRAYFEQLRKLLPDGRIYVEKILEEEETLPADWPVDGTVGYDFMNRVNRLWMDESRAESLTSIYADFTGHPTNYLSLAREQKEFVLQRHFRADLTRLTDLAFVVAQERYETRDMSRLDLEQALVQTIVALPVYRTYLDDQSDDPEQRRILADALRLGRSLSQPLTESRAYVFDSLEKMLLGEKRTPGQEIVLSRFQQLAPAVMAKGAEDTTFYRFDRLVSCNEVGSQPSALGISAEHFHQYMSHLFSSWPRGMLTTSTHDTKRSEDVRARISLLSEIPDTWGEQVRTWAEQNAHAWKGRDRDSHAEYLLYQTLVGAHPLSRERAFAYLQKAVREAKIYSSWHEPDQLYEEKLQDFIFGILADDTFCRSLDAFCQPLVAPGRINSLSQTLIKLTAPGVPDFYQGTELWDLSLVDPDNRRPVDFQKRAEMLAQARDLSVFDLAEHWDSGLVKLWMIQRTLAVRRSLLDLQQADYRPLIARGEKLRHVLSYVRGHDLVVVVPRFLMSIQGDFGNTELELPEGDFECAFSGQRFGGVVLVSDLFDSFPVSLLIRK